MRHLALPMYIALLLWPIASVSADDTPTAVFPPPGPNSQNIVQDPRVRRVFTDLVEVHGQPIVLHDPKFSTAYYRGSTYRLDPDTDFRTVPQVLLRSVLGRFEAGDFIPEARLRHFSWCNRPDLKVVGWSGQVESILAGTQGLVVQVRITPRLVKVNSVAPATLDAFVEFYHVDEAGIIEFLGGIEKPGCLPQSVFEF